MNQDLKTDTLALLEQFGQVILSGPPGTGKTRLALHVAASILGEPDAESLPIGEDSPFALVQFHPSYNYEDFVRGIQVKTDNNNNVVYETIDRVFGDMAKRAAVSDAPHVLVIDEINRANVSAVLGELIYGLEYRGEEVQTPYKVDGEKGGTEEGKAGLVIPKNLQIIGTMNTADRTIGQIDYAVRRRFAFIHCLPDDSVVKNIGGARALEFFEMVDNVFARLSADYDKEDVCIGHSYFLADGVALANKIIYQVVPILREYVKDGVLLKAAEGKIQEIENKARAMTDDVSVAPNLPSAPKSSEHAKGNPQWRWEHMNSDAPSKLSSLRQTILSLVRDYVQRTNCPNLAKLQRAFPNDCAICPAIALDREDNKVQNKWKKEQKFFMNESKGEPIAFPDGMVAVVCGGWAMNGHARRYFENFRVRAREQGYGIWAKVSMAAGSWVVNVGEHEGRDWETNRIFDFWSAGQDLQSIGEAKRLKEGALIFAYLNKRGQDEGGYVGVGIVVKEAQPIGDFIVKAGQHRGKRLMDCVNVDHLNKNLGNPEKCEWAVSVNWLETRNRDDAAKIRPIRGIVRHVTDENIVDALKKEFHILTDEDE